MRITGNEAEELYTHAITLLKDEKNPQALVQAETIFNGLFNSVWRHEGETTGMLFHLGSVHMKRGNNALAALLFEKCIENSPDLIEAYSNIGYLYKEEQKIEKAKYYFEKSLEMIEKLDPAIATEKNNDKAVYLTNLGALYIANGTPQKAIEIFEEAIKLDPRESEGKAAWNLGLAHLESGHYDKGFDYYEKGERIDRTKERHYSPQGTPFWDGTPGKTVVVFGEQGLGDEIMFASMLPDIIKDCKVIIDAHPRLADMFRMNFPGIPVYGTRKTNELLWAKHHRIDAKISIGSLGRFYRRKESDFPKTPYLQADPELVEKYRKKLNVLSLKPKIGISWRGGIKRTNKDERHIPLDMWKDILGLDATFISLQYDKDIGHKVEEFEKETGLTLHHWESVLADYDETAGLISNLDLIISVPQSVVHLAGALGVPTWQLCPKRAMWQMGVNGKDMPWYACVKNIWQDESKNWEPIMSTVKEKLCTLLQTNTER